MVCLPLHNSMSCSMSADAFKQAAPSLPSSCAALNQKCPGLFSGTP